MQSRVSGRRLGLLAMMSLLVAWGVVMAQPAWAEWTFDAYVGMSFLPDGDVEASGVNDNVGFDDSFIVGGRLGYWLGLFPYVGAALDVSYYTSDLNYDIRGQHFDNFDLKRIPLSGLAMLRLPVLPTPLAPRGQLEPYLAIGPTLMLSNLDFDNKDLRKDVGLDVRAGLNVRLTRALGVFAEYRLTYVEQEFHFSRAGLESVAKADPSTHHLAGGISLRF